MHQVAVVSFSLNGKRRHVSIPFNDYLDRRQAFELLMREFMRALEEQFRYEFAKLAMQVPPLTAKPDPSR